MRRRRNAAASTGDASENDKLLRAAALRTYGNLRRAEGSSGRYIAPSTS